MTRRSCDRHIDYPDLTSQSPGSWLPILNSPAVRRHLIEHPQFDRSAVRRWLRDKQGIDALPGCRVRAVRVDGHLAGWCGIQPDGADYELALVLDAAWWGVGRRVYQALLTWAMTFGHATVLVRLHQSRRPSTWLLQLALSVESHEHMGSHFVTYRIPVPRALEDSTGRYRSGSRIQAGGG
ncbi:MAG: GNAT family N-acetyltransferase [Nevskiales bacterium]|nr:GNAT family N-acetyltransferase [Nevskiales bacterium]